MRRYLLLVRAPASIVRKVPAFDVSICVDVPLDAATPSCNGRWQPALPPKPVPQPGKVDGLSPGRPPGGGGIVSWSDLEHQWVALSLLRLPLRLNECRPQIEAIMPFGELSWPGK